MGWFSGSSRNYDNAKTETVDPRKVRWHNNHPVKRSTVEKYKRNPNAHPDDGDAYIIRNSNGQLVGINGRHRGIAAAETGRKLKARVHNEGRR